MANSRPTVSRRSVLKASGATVTGASLAGCSGTIGGSSDTVSIGITLPQSGNTADVGQNFLRSVRTGISLAQENDDAGGREIEELGVGDTQADVSTGVEEARGFIDDGADIIIGNSSSSVALAIGELCAREDVLYICTAGALAASGADCQKIMFNTSDSAVGQANASLRWAINEGYGNSVYGLYADYSWGQSHKEYTENTLISDVGAEYAGGTLVPFGEQDYSQHITTASNSDADIIYLPLWGGDHVRSALTVQEFGLLDEFVWVWPVTTFNFAEQLPQELISHENVVYGNPWYWELDNPAAAEFADTFNEEYDSRPMGYGAGLYAGLRTALASVNDAGTTDAVEVANAMEGRNVHPQIWGTDATVRACDHRFTVAGLTVRGRPPSDFTGDNPFEVLNIPEDGEEYMLPCERDFHPPNCG